MLLPAAGQAQSARPRPAIDPPVQYARMSPEACLAVPQVVDHLRLEGRPDTALYMPARDQLSPGAQAEVAQCVEANGGTSEHPWQWMAVARAQLALGNDSAAGRWHEKYLAHLASASLPRRAWARYLVVASYAGARPARLGAAMAALHPLEALGRPAARARMMAHLSVLSAAKRHWDDTLQVRAAGACLAAYRQLAPAVQELLSIPASLCVRTHAEVVLRHRGGPPAVAVLDSGLAVLPSGSGGRGIVESSRRHYALVGQSAASIEATHWFRREPPLPKPVRGKVTVLHAVRHFYGTEAQYQALRRLASRFARQPFELIAYTQTFGFFGDSALPIPPAREAALDSAYFYGYARMPGTLAVHEAAFTITVDGRRKARPTPHETNYASIGLVVIDKRGIVRYVASGVGGYGEEIVTRMIETLLAEP